MKIRRNSQDICAVGSSMRRLVGRLGDILRIRGQPQHPLLDSTRPQQQLGRSHLATRSDHSLSLVLFSPGLDRDPHPLQRRRERAEKRGQRGYLCGCNRTIFQRPVTTPEPHLHRAGTATLREPSFLGAVAFVVPCGLRIRCDPLWLQHVCHCERPCIIWSFNLSALHSLHCNCPFSGPAVPPPPKPPLTSPPPPNPSINGPL